MMYESTCAFRVTKYSLLRRRARKTRFQTQLVNEILFQKQSQHKK
jgi:hypothetical protein